MKNVYEIKKEKSLNYILPKKEKLCQLNSDIYQTIIIVIHIYYYDRINMYFNYIENIPNDIFLFITISEERSKKIISSFLDKKRKKYKIIMKENRGRDISSLLVVARKEILKYQYVCFLHDKKEKNAEKRQDIEQWNYCLWENSVGSKAFIENIIYTFKKNNNLGLLVPPSPITENLEYGYSNLWGENFELTEKLANQMNLNCNLDNSFPPIALGTVFWAKTEALKPLFQIEWKYENFKPEPLPDDGTLSHAIERILPYVAQDAGYTTGWVMNDQYAAKQWEYSIDLLNVLFGFLENTQKIIHISKSRKLFTISKQLPLFCRQYSRIYIYGAGQVGKRCYSLMISLDIIPESFLVSNIKENGERFCGVLVQSIEEVVLNEASGVVIAVGKKLVEEIQNKLFSKKVPSKNIFIFE